MLSEGDITYRDKTIPDKLVNIIYNLLVEVSPKHIDEVAFYDRESKLLITVFPAIQIYMSYSTFQEDKKWLKKSNHMLKRQFNLSEIHRVKVYSEEIKLDRIVNSTLVSVPRENT